MLSRDLGYKISEPIATAGTLAAGPATVSAGADLQ
jgi:hypothetical protein